MSDTSLIDQTKQTLRRTRQAYFGALGMTYDFAKGRFAKRRQDMRELYEAAYEQGETMDAKAREQLGRAKAEVEERTSDTLGDLEDAVENAGDAVQDLKEDIVLQAKKERKQAILSDKIEDSEKYAPYLEKVRAYDKDVDPIYVMKIVDHLGSALSSRDSMFVACSDETERATVAKNWLSKTLNVSGSKEELDQKVQAVCQTMKSDRLKDRVVFYYLAAKAEGKLSAL